MLRMVPNNEATKTGILRSIARHWGLSTIFLSTMQSVEKQDRDRSIQQHGWWTSELNICKCQNKIKYAQWRFEECAKEIDKRSTECIMELGYCWPHFQSAICELMMSWWLHANLRTISFRSNFALVATWYLASHFTRIRLCVAPIPNKCACAMCEFICN